MRHAVTIAALVLTIGVGACATGATQEEFTRADQEAIRRNAAGLSAAFNDKQLDRIIEFYADNTVFMPPNAPSLRGREPLRDFFAGMIENGAIGLTLESTEVSGHGPLAYEAGSYVVTYQNRASRDRGKYLLVLRNMGGTWRTEKTIWSSDLPVPHAPAD
ncbi:MAG TPA: DUF4440 domain-containing protein [Vicinamibacterales bacterium]|nr:DUF4440 domain-containing protein [Vicinamibacterales bacterium]